MKAVRATIRIYIMRMSRTGASAFTLLELLFTMLIIGIALSLGAAYFQPRSSELEKITSSLTGALSRSRAEAMLSRKRSTMAFADNKIYLLAGDGKRHELISLPPDVSVRINGKSLMRNKPVQITFGPLGYASENIIYLDTADESWTIYIPSLSSPLSRRGYYSPEEIRKEVP